MKQSIARHIKTSHTCFSRRNTPYLLEKHSVSLGETHCSSVWSHCKELLLTFLSHITEGLSPCAIRYATMLLLMMVVGLNTTWGQQMTNFEGAWYIASNGNSTNPSNYAYNVNSSGTNYYLRPAADPQQSNKTDAFFDGSATTPEKPFLTTNQTGHTDIALWILEKTDISYNITKSSSGVDYYYTIRNVETGKYVVCDPYFSGTLGENNTSRRKTMHLETKSWTTTIPDKALFKIRYTLDENTGTGDTFDSYCFIPKLVENKEFKYWNIADKNQPYNYGTGSNDQWWGGLVGLYKFGASPANTVDPNSRFKFEQYVVEQPTITFNNATNEVTITSSVTGAKIYYTTDGNIPTSELTAYTSPVTFTQATPCTIRAIAVKSWSSGVEVSSVEGTYNLQKVATPTITINADNSVTITCSTEDATIYYKLGGDAPTTDGIQSSTIASILPSQGPIKAIAAKEGLLNSSVAEESMIPAKTIVVNSTNASLTSTDPIVYNGTAQQPAFTVMDGEVTIDPSEYSAAFSNNTTAGTATITITDNADGDYTVSGSFTFSIAKKSLTVISGITASDKTYDGTTTATLDCTGAVFEGKVGNDDLTIVSATGTFDNKNVGTNKHVDITGLTFGGTAAGNYTLAESGNQSSITASISAKDVTACGTIAASSKVYDGTTTAVFDYTGVTLDGKVDGDVLSYTATGAFADKNVGTGKSITISSEGLSGDDVGNYHLSSSNVSTTTTASITPAEITVSGITAENKVYNSNTTATLVYSGVTFAGKVDGDVLSVTATGTFVDANVDTGITVNISGLTLGGADAGNYSLAGSGHQTETTADISAKAVTITAGSKSKDWDGDPLTWTIFTATALEEGDNHTFTVYMTAESTITNVGTTPNVIATVDGVAVTTGNETAVGNYLVTTVDGTLTITGSQNITITLTMGNSTYGSNTKNPNVTIMPKDAKDATRTFYYKVKDADDATYTTDKPTKISNAGTYTVKVVVDPYQSYNGGEATTDFTINKAPLQIQANNVSKEYLDPDPEITYAATGFVNDEIQDDILRGNLSRATGETIGDYVISNDNGNLTDVTNNYEISITSATFSIIPKSLGEGDAPAKGISIAIKEDSNSATGYTTTVSNNGKENLIENTDYTLVGTGSGDNYTVTITAKEGNGKYTGSAKATYGSFTFYQISNTEFIAPYIANETDLVTDGKVKPYIVRNVNPSAGTISITSVGYIPEGIPVLLLTDEEANGLTTAKKDDEIESISATALSLNKLKFSKGMTVETAQVYRFYRGEFVLTLSGSLPTGVFYLDNPNYNNPAPVASPSFLRIIRNTQDEETGIVEIQNNEKESIQEDCWYTIDGYRLNGKPVKKGLYIKGRSKVFVK